MQRNPFCDQPFRYRNQRDRAYRGARPCARFVWCGLLWILWRQTSRACVVFAVCVSFPQWKSISNPKYAKPLKGIWCVNHGTAERLRPLSARVIGSPWSVQHLATRFSGDTEIKLSERDLEKSSWRRADRRGQRISRRENTHIPIRFWKKKKVDVFRCF